jgi:ABC-type dipeptide/oligopeptide/nickel transport system permease component/ABC-type transport system substrate-binding protein
MKRAWILAAAAALLAVAPPPPIAAVSAEAPTAAPPGTPAAVSAEAPAAPPAAVPIAGPVHGGRIVVGMQLEPPVLDPTANPASAISEALYGNVYEGLVQFAPDGSPAPSLASSWDVSDDGRSYLFHLRAGVHFHDGTPFDASAAKFSLDRALAPGSVNPQRARIAKIRTVEVVDTLELRVLLTRRSAGLLESLAWGAFVMVSPRSAADDAVHPVGTGPFAFAEWRRGDSLRLERNPGYWGRPASLDEVTFKFIADPTAAYAALMARDVDVFANYPAPESFAQFTADRRFRTLAASSEMETVLALNERVAPLGNLLVRRAISHALDRRAIIDGAMFGYGTPIGSHFPPSNPAYVDLTGRYPHDPARARALLAEAGYPHGLALTLKLPPPSYARRSGEIVAAELADVGIRVRIENLEWAQWLDQVFTRHDFDMSIVGHAEPMDYDIYARDDYYFGYSSPELKALIAELDDSADPSRRRSLLGQIQRKIAEDAVNGFLFQHPRLEVWNARIHGLAFDNVLGFVDLRGATRVGAAPMGGRGAARASARDPPRRWPVVLFAAVLALCGALVMRRLGATYLVGRAATLIATLLAATVLVFVVVEVVPGDPVRYMMGMQADAGSVAATRHQLGLDQAAPQRYAQWVLGLARGDFGTSYTYRVPVRGLILERLQISVPLALLALTLAAVLALPVGMISAAREGRAVDAILGGATLLGLAVPSFWLGMLLVVIFSISLHWVPAGGFPGWDAGLVAGLGALILPAIALALPQAAILARTLRGALIGALREDYVRTARAKGASARRVLWRHALPNALVPVLTILGMQFSFLLAGAVIVENVFFLPGLGRLVFQAIVQRDLIVVQSVVMLLVFAVVTVTFVVDLSYVLIDPRLREAAAR